MKLIKTLITLALLLTYLVTNAQDEHSKTWSGKTYFNASFYRLGSYVKERPTLFLEQDFQYNLSPNLSLGGGLGINLYPALLGFPVFINGQYHFNFKTLLVNINQSYGKNIKIGKVFFNSNRYSGSVDVLIPLKAIHFVPALGYNFLWDKYGGKNLSFYLGIGIQYHLIK